MNCADKADIVKGTMNQFWQPLLLRKISKEIVIKAIKWFEGLREIDESLGDCTYLIFELLSSVSLLLYGIHNIKSESKFCSLYSSGI